MTDLAGSALKRVGMTLEQASAMTDRELLALRGVGPASLARIRAAGAELDASVVAGVRRDLEAIARRDPALARSSLAATALSLARELDADDARSKAMAARELRETMDRIRALAPAESAGDDVDELAVRVRLKLVGDSGA